jgi:hypothetical protein
MKPAIRAIPFRRRNTATIRSIGEPMRTMSRRSGDTTTSPRSASLDDAYLSTPPEKKPKKKEL